MSSSSDSPSPLDHQATRLVHAGVRPGSEGSVVTPISVSTTFRAPAAGELAEFDYARSSNPSRKSLEEALAAAEDAVWAGAFSSGLAAIDAVVRLCRPGDRIIVGTDAYGGTWRLLTAVWSQFGIGVVVVDTTDLDAVAVAADDAAMMFIETPTNPTLQITDIAAVADVCSSRGVRLVVDSTFATPYLTQPLALGADIVVHSATKYISGHSDVVGGAVATNDVELADQVAFTQRAVGAVPGPFDSFLMLRGLRTLGVRMDRHGANAAAVAAMLDEHPAVVTTMYPGLAHHPGHAVATSQMSGGSRGYGGMVSFTVDSEAVALKVVENTRLFICAESLGGVESLIEHPASMTHASTAGSPLDVDRGLVRCSVGIEDAADLVADLHAAIDEAHRSD